MSDNDLTGHRVLAIVSNYGVEQDELVVPVQHFRDRGAEVDVAAVSADPVQTLVGDKENGQRVEPDLTLEEVDPASYDLLHVSGGTLNADSLRLNDTAVEVLRSFTRSGSPVAAICHGPWLLVEGAEVGGKTLTSYPSLETDIRNAGGSWVDQSVSRDDAGGWTLVTSRTPNDLSDYLTEADSALVETPART
ncbi:DJ-1/PfpI/YhbO family deglycase/protease [Streptomyces xiaopingdaonensis]|uniref:DJ-1/PfpI/YhbO family deglycase/protease n=1 Tax=Streptomyces xiaopingdaonensis TaxID=1565415 RepID=UPI0002ED18AD|nr:DJ-1/PfpI/YhbO family deglycase/protease [Streptomyces xiaopingdaonensis]